MIYLEAPTDVVFYDNNKLRNRHIRIYNDVTLELADGKVESVITSNLYEYMKYSALIGTSKIDLQ